jgi:hypothetical protein
MLLAWADVTGKCWQMLADADRCCWQTMLAWQMLLADADRCCWQTMLAWEMLLADVAGRCCWQNGAAPEIERMVALLDQVPQIA